MTEPLRDQIAHLRVLSPQLNDVTDQASKLVQRVERLLVDELSIGIACSAPVLSEQNDAIGLTKHVTLDFDRFEGKFRLFVKTKTLVDGSLDESWKLWGELPRDMKLLSFQRIPELLADLAAKVQKAIRETEGASRTILELVGAIGGPERVPEPEKTNTRLKQKLEARRLTIFSETLSNLTQGQHTIAFLNFFGEMDCKQRDRFFDQLENTQGLGLSSEVSLQLFGIDNAFSHLSEKDRAITISNMKRLYGRKFGEEK